MKRRGATLGETVDILRRQALCPKCGVPLNFGEVRRDHIVPLAMGGADAVGNLQIIHDDCHLAKTVGEATAASRRGSDITEIARAKRTSRRYEAFRQRLLAKGSIEPQEPLKKRWKWGKRHVRQNRNPRPGKERAEADSA